METRGTLKRKTYTELFLNKLQDGDGDENNNDYQNKNKLSDSEIETCGTLKRKTHTSLYLNKVVDVDEKNNDYQDDSKLSNDKIKTNDGGRVQESQMEKNLLRIQPLKIEKTIKKKHKRPTSKYNDNVRRSMNGNNTRYKNSTYSSINSTLDDLSKIYYCQNFQSLVSSKKRNNNIFDEELNKLKDELIYISHIISKIYDRIYHLNSLIDKFEKIKLPSLNAAYNKNYDEYEKLRHTSSDYDIVFLKYNIDNIDIKIKQCEDDINKIKTSLEKTHRLNLDYCKRHKINLLQQIKDLENL